MCIQCFPLSKWNCPVLPKTMQPRILNKVAIGAVFLALNSCTEQNRLIPQTRCFTAVAIATQTWEVNYYTSKTSGGLNTQRSQPFQSNTITNLNGEKPTDAVSVDDNGIGWAALPPRPTADEVDQRREIQEQNDSPQLQRSVEYQLRCESGTLKTDAPTYREASRAIRSGQSVRVSYIGDRALKIKAQEPKTSQPTQTYSSF